MKQQLATIAKIAAIVLIIGMTVWYVRWMREPAYQPPDNFEEVKKVLDGVNKARAAGKAPTAPERMQREDRAGEYLRSQVAEKKPVPQAVTENHMVFVPSGAWPGGDQNLALGLAELYSTYFHADGNSRKTVVVQDGGNSNLLAKEFEDGQMQLVDKFGQPLP